MKKHLALAVTALAVAAFFSATAVEAHAAPTLRIFNDGNSLEVLQNRLLELNTESNNITSLAAAENRELTDAERGSLDAIFNEFETVEADIERLEKAEGINARMAQSAGRQAAPAVVPEDLPQNAGTPPAQQSRAQVSAGARRSAPLAAVPRDNRAAGAWGFRSQAEFFAAVKNASARGSTPDPRLIANAPTTYGQEGVGSDGGFAVPPDFRSEIVKKIMGEDSLLNRTDQMVTSSNGITVPIDSTAPWDSTGGIQAYWEQEGGQKQQSKPQLGEVTVKANKVIVLVPMTDELLQDAPAMARYVTQKAPEKIDFKVNDALINGSGVGQPLGILNSDGTVVVAKESGQAADTVIYENVVNMYTRMPGPSRRNAVWLANGDIEAQLMSMKFPGQGSGNAIPVYMPPGGLSVAPYATLLGRPIISTEAMPNLGDAGDLILADMSKYMSVIKAGGVRQDISIHLFFDYDITAFRFVLRVGGQPWFNSPISRPNGQTSRGFFIALGARA